MCEQQAVEASNQIILSCHENKKHLQRVRELMDLLQGDLAVISAD